MANSKYYSEGKYRCNHPESDFEKTSTNPIEMKKENFIEYTHRNETANYRYDVWNEKNKNPSTPKYNRYKNPTISIGLIFAIFYAFIVVVSMIFEILANL